MAKAVLIWRAGVATPAIDRLVELVHEIERGRRSQSPETFDALAAVCS